jgi:MarR family
MYIPAHIGKIPVEEWLPFVVPVLALYLFSRRELRRRRAAVARLPDVGEGLDDATVSRILARWSATDHKEVSSEYLPLLYPPGPDGMTAADLATRLHSSASAVARQLEDLADLGYVELQVRDGADDLRASLTAEGYDLLIITEEVLVSALPDRSLESRES